MPGEGGTIATLRSWVSFWSAIADAALIFRISPRNAKPCTGSVSHPSGSMSITRMAIAKAKGWLRGKKPKLGPSQEAHLVELHQAGRHTTTELAELFNVARSTVYRAINRAAVEKPAELDHAPTRTLFSLEVTGGLPTRLVSGVVFAPVGPPAPGRRRTRRGISVRGRSRGRRRRDRHRDRPGRRLG
jgi:hypothetical protein